MKIYNINKGKHSSGLHLRPYWGLKDAFSGKFVLGDGSRHITMQKDCQGDINKITGISLGWCFDDFSIRVGERYIPDKDHFEIWPYVHKDGMIDQTIFSDPDKYLLATITTNQPMKFSIYRYNSTKYSLGIGLETSSVLKWADITFNSPMPTHGWVLYPYFGGNCRYPGGLNGETKKVVKVEYKIK